MYSTLRKIAILLTITGMIASCDDGSNEAANAAQLESQLDLADLYRRQGQFRASLIEAQNALQLDSNSIDTRLFVSQVFWDLGDSNAAIDVLSSALQVAPENIDVKIALSESYLLARRYQEGFDLINEVTTGNEDQLNKKDWLLGNFEAALGNAGTAEDYFERVLSRNSTDVETLLSLARLKYLTGDVDAAMSLTEQAVEANTDSENVDIWIWQGQLAALQENWPAAEEAYFEALDIMSLYDTMTAKRFSTLQSILTPLRNQQKNSEALRYSQIIASSPQGQLLESFSNALSLFEAGDIQQAESLLFETLELAPNHPGSNILLGLSRYQQGDFQEAERLLTEFVEIDSASAEMVTTLADTYLKLNDMAGALEVLEEASANSPENISFLAMLGIIKQSMGDQDGALENLEQALQIEPESAELLYTLGSMQVQRGDIGRAMQNFSAAIESNPDFETAKTGLLNILVAQNNISAASDQINSWLNEAPDNVFNNLAAGTLAARDENFSSARGYFEKALELEEGNTAARINLARVELLEGNYTAAETHYNEVLSVEPTNETALSGLLAMGDLAGTQEAQIARINQIISENPEEPLPAIVLGQYFMVSEDLDNAEQYGETALAMVDNELTRNFLAEVSVQRGINASVEGDTETALGYANDALEIDIDYVRALLLATNLEAQSDNFVQAQNHIDRLKELQPNQAGVYELEGDLIVSMNDPNGAINSYMRAWDLQPETQLGLKIYQVYGLIGDNRALENFLGQWSSATPGETTPVLLLAMMLQDDGREDEALAYYEQVYSDLDDNVLVLNNMAWNYRESDPARALELASRANELFPDNPDVLDTYGWILHLQGQQQSAIEALEKAAALDPESDLIQEHLNTVKGN